MYNALNPPTDEKKQAIRQSRLFGTVTEVSKKLRLEPEPKPIPDTGVESVTMAFQRVYSVFAEDQG